ncbi:nucleoside hydrolase [Naumannella sp. ID2617S]|nr:nucleoside hydrolase [Naumannella sp. ID2617S]
MRLLADVDTGIDDALALIWLAAREDVDLVGVSTTSGNTTAEQAAWNSLAVLESCGRFGVEVCTGTPTPLQVPPSTTPETHGDEGLGHAVLAEPRGSLSQRGFLDLWLDELRTHPGETTLLVTGPLTNLAVALRAEPRLPELMGRVVIMGGAFEHPGNTTPTAEWNAWVDPHAAAEAYAAWQGRPAPLPTVCSLGVTEPVTLDPAWLDALAERLGVPAPRLSPQRPRADRVPPTQLAWFDLLVESLRFYFEFHLDWGYGYLAQMHDLCAAMVALDAVAYQSQPVWVGVETDSPLTRGTTVRDTHKLLGHPANAEVVTAVDPAAIRERLLQDLLSRSARPDSSAPAS